MMLCHFCTDLCLISIGLNLIPFFLPHSVLTVSKPFIFLFDAAKKIFFSFPVFCSHFSLQLKISFLLQIPSRGIRVLSRPYFTQNTVPQIYHSPILAEAFPLNLTIFHTILSLSHPENYYIDLFFLSFFVTNCITNCLKK